MRQLLGSFIWENSDTVRRLDLLSHFQIGTKTLVVYMKTEITILKDKKWMVHSVKCVIFGRMRKESSGLKKKQLKKCHHMNQKTTRTR